MAKKPTHSSSDAKFDGFPRWDRSNGPHVPGSRGSWPIHTATGPCDPGNDGNAWIAFDRVGDFVFDEEHLYIGAETRPRDRSRDA